jgi:hypothetical protein
LRLVEHFYDHKFGDGGFYDGKKWKNPAKEVDYNFAPKLDSDVTNTIKHYTSSEAEYGKWDLLQLNHGSDPICGSLGCPKSEYVKAEEAKVVQYPVNVPLDSDI